MSNFSASIPVADMRAANTTLEELGHGPNNFSVPAYAGPSPSAGLLHAWGDPVFEAAVAAIDGVIINQGEDPAQTTTDAASAAGATWGQDALPLTGTVTPGLYVDANNVLWWVIQSYNTATYPEPILIPALIRVAKIPGEALPWQQPIDQYDAYKLVNPFTGMGDYSLHKGVKWQVTQADGSGNNVWEPGVFGWSNIGPAPQIQLNLDGDQYDDVVVAQVGNVTITEDADSYDIDLDGDGIADLHIPKP
jgi:hypothetical protein